MALKNCRCIKAVPVIRDHAVDDKDICVSIRILSVADP